MKMIMFVFIFTIMNQFVFSQSDVMQFFSMGFNARANSSGDTAYYFYGYEGYSEAFVFDTQIRLSTGEPRTFYPNGLITYGFPPYEYIRYSGQNNSIGYENILPTIGYYGEEHKFENDKLVYWALTNEKRPYTTLERIEQSDQRIIIYVLNGKQGFHYRYYNISRTELLDQFLKRYVELICIINKMVNDNSQDYVYDLIIPVLQGRTARELAILRNCLFTIKGYKFSNSTWIEFFNKYLESYRPQYSNAEVIAMFTNNEKWLLDLVIQYENRR